MPKVAQRLAHMKVSLAGGGDPEARPGAVKNDAVEPVRARICHRCGQPEMAVHLFLLRRRPVQAPVSPSRGVDNAFGQVCVNPFGSILTVVLASIVSADGLDTDPKPGEA